MSRKNKYMATGFATGGISSSQKNRIILYLIIGAAILAIGVFVLFVLPGMGILDNPYNKNEDNKFKMGEGNSSITATPVPPTPTPKNKQEEREMAADGEEFTHKVDLVDLFASSNMETLEKAYSYNDGDVLKGYAKVIHCNEHEEIGTRATMQLYSDGNDNFINHLEKNFESLCIDPGKEPPHDGVNRNGRTQWDGNKESNWYGLKNYGYTATLKKSETEKGILYDWSVLVNFDYGASSKYSQRMKFHIAYEAAGKNEE